MIYHRCLILLFRNQRIILKLAGEQSVFNRFNRVLQSSKQTFLSDDVVNSSGPSVGADELKLMKREWSPAVSITTGRVLSWFWVGGGACCQDTGRIQSGGPAVLLDNTLDPLATANWPLT
ncbi:hypothetical protein ABVT39_019740 [Epinephelus coioides]